MPRIRPAIRSGWKISSASYFSPTPMNLIGLPVTALDRERRAAARVTVHLGQHHAGQCKALIELACGVDGVLAGHRIGDQQHFLRIEQLVKPLELDHQGVVDVQSTGGIDQERVVTGIPRLLISAWRARSIASFCPGGSKTGTSMALPITDSCSIAAGR